MNCKNCGAIIKDGAKFCTACGQTVHMTSDVPTGGYQPQPGYTPPQSGYYNPQQDVYPGPVYQQPIGGYYTGQQGQSTSSGVKLFMILFMVLALLMSAVGLMRFPYVASSEMDTISEVSNMSTFSVLWNSNDGKIGDVLEDIFDGLDDEGVFVLSFTVSLAMFGIAVIIAVISLICGIAGIHSGAASMTGTGMIILAVGYLANLIEGINYFSELDNDRIRNHLRIGLMPPIMMIVCLAMGIIAFIAAGRLRKEN